jgi:hypothetical protein
MSASVALLCTVQWLFLSCCMCSQPLSFAGFFQVVAGWPPTQAYKGQGREVGGRGGGSSALSPVLCSLALADVVSSSVALQVRLAHKSLQDLSSCCCREWLVWRFVSSTPFVALLYACNSLHDIILLSLADLDLPVSGLSCSAGALLLAAVLVLHTETVLLVPAVTLTAS